MSVPAGEVILTTCESFLSSTSAYYTTPDVPKKSKSRNNKDSYCETTENMVQFTA